MILPNKKITIVVTICLVSFVVGRASVPKPKPEIRVIDNSKSVEKAVADTKKQMTEAFQKQIVLETYTVRSKSGSSKTDTKKTITYSKNSFENIHQKLQDNLKTSDNQTTEVKQKYDGIDYTFMVGRSFSDARYDYFASIGVPLFAGIKANGGYEFQDKRIFIGASLNF